jgi:hypothetical protein
VATPSALVERSSNFDKNPRLAKVVGFFIIPAAGQSEQKTAP